MVVDHLVELAIEQPTPVPIDLARTLPIDAGGAVGGDAVVPARLVDQGVGVDHVFEKHLADLFWLDLQAIQVNVVVLQVLGPFENRVAFVAHHVDDFLLPIQAAEEAVLLPPTVADFDRHAEPTLRTEVEHQHRMAEERRAPIDDDAIDAVELGKVIVPRFELRCVILGSSIDGVTNVVHRDIVAVDDEPRQHGVVRFPIAVVRGLLGEPPHKERSEANRQQEQRLPEGLPQRKYGRAPSDEHQHQWPRVPACTSDVEVDRPNGPQHSNRGNQ